MRYLDAYVFSVPKKKLQDYRRMKDNGVILTTTN